MHLKKPFLICNTDHYQLSDANINLTQQPAMVIMRDLKNQYELQVFLGAININEILIYRENESIKIYKNDSNSKICSNTLLYHFYMPSNVNTDALKVKRSQFGICVILPKTQSTHPSVVRLLPIE
ncbi:hypothetical protein F0919_00485 [Taibaiella lutea]|uniref:SHSP domain-containing protein n=1 Tax=Taibaiella lutea TaxID=2608001 RepID=A0A5M6CP51_9BACT|nr:hypothetical protein [Taibaiella lutea]KAA5536180.1 hypothetical protein F0919_00485 [Taibaiella lutea]